MQQDVACAQAIHYSLLLSHAHHCLRCGCSGELLPLIRVSLHQIISCHFGGLFFYNMLCLWTSPPTSTLTWGMYISILYLSDQISSSAAPYFSLLVKLFSQFRPPAFFFSTYLYYSSVRNAFIYSQVVIISLTYLNTSLSFLYSSLSTTRNNMSASSSCC
jgi:hypothetical protein